MKQEHLRLNIRSRPYPSFLALALIIFLVPAFPASAGENEGFYRLDESVPLPSDDPDWDYMALDEPRNHLFIAQRGDGATVVDTVTRQRLLTIDDSAGANAIALAEPMDRGFVINEDGTATVFQLTNLKTLSRVRFGQDADAAAFEPVTGQIVVMMGDSQAIAFLNAKTGELNGTLDVEADKLEAPTPDGKGNFFVSQRSRDSIARFDAAGQRQVAEWETGDCEQPTGLAFDAEHHRLFAGCRGHGAKPLLLVMDADTGAVITTLDIGRGNDGVIYDAGTRKIFTSNGVDGNLVIYRQLGPDSYELEEATTTRPYARTMAMDHRNKAIYMVTAEGTVDPSKPVNTGPARFYPNVHYAGTFELLIYLPQ